MWLFAYYLSTTQEQTTTDWFFSTYIQRLKLKTEKINKNTDINKTHIILYTIILLFLWLLTHYTFLHFIILNLFWHKEKNW